jgi:hypothetical protein
MNLVPGYLYVFVLAGSVAAAATVLIGLKRSLKLAKWAESDRQQAFRKISILLVAWAAVAIGLSWLGAYEGSARRAPTIQYGVLIPIVAGVLLYQRWETLRRAVEAVPQEWLVGVQFYRTLGLIFLVLYAQGHMPGAFAWPAGAGDIFVGLLAPVVAFAYARRWTSARRWVQAWNGLGLFDLVVALTTGFLTSPSPLQVLAFDSPNRLISAFPLAMVPVFLVPLSILLHLASLAKLRRAATEQSSLRPALAGQHS